MIRFTDTDAKREAIAALADALRLSPKQLDDLADFLDDDADEHLLELPDASEASSVAAALCRALAGLTCKS